MTQPHKKNSPLSQIRFDAAALSEILNTVFRPPVQDVAFLPLQGDASDRKYFRLSFRVPAEKDAPDSAILMQLSEPVAGGEFNFTSVLKFLRGLKLPVPRLYHYDSGRGLVFLEDLGPRTLEDELKRHPEKTETYYRQAVTLLADLHHRATQSAGPDCPAFGLRFDVEKLMWELDFMIEHFVSGLRGVSLSQNGRAALRESLLPLCETLAAEPLCFTHRDYHCRNLMVHDGNLVMIDFQDARMGPCQYDLASLLKDSYVSLKPELRREMIELYIRSKEKLENRSVDRDAFLNMFDLMSIQRNLKAVGTFAYQSVVRGNDRYLQYIPRTLAYVQETLSKRKDLDALQRALRQHVLWQDAHTLENRR